MQGWFWWVHTGGGAGRVHDAEVAGHRRLTIRRSEAQKTTWAAGCVNAGLSVWEAVDSLAISCVRFQSAELLGRIPIRWWQLPFAVPRHAVVNPSLTP